MTRTVSKRQKPPESQLGLQKYQLIARRAGPGWRRRKMENSSVEKVPSLLMVRYRPSDLNSHFWISICLMASPAFPFPPAPLPLPFTPCSCFGIKSSTAEQGRLRISLLLRTCGQSTGKVGKGQGKQGGSSGNRLVRRVTPV